jgi:voltage-gated potassium channel
MKTKLLLKVMKRTGILRMIAMFILVFFIAALLIMLVEPDINNIPDALWYTFVASSSIGFGDMCVQTHVGRIITVIITLYGLLITAMITGVILTFYIEYIKVKEKDSIDAFHEQLDNLANLSGDELKRLSERIKELKKDDK